MIIMIATTTITTTTMHLQKLILTETAESERPGMNNINVQYKKNPKSFWFFPSKMPLISL